MPSYKDDTLSYYAIVLAITTMLIGCSQSIYLYNRLQKVEADYAALIKLLRQRDFYQQSEESSLLEDSEKIIVEHYCN